MFLKLACFNDFLNDYNNDRHHNRQIKYLSKDVQSNGRLMAPAVPSIAMPM